METKWNRITPDNMPEVDTPVWLWDGRKVWIGGRSEDGDGYFWGTYRMAYRYGSKWKYDMDADDDYSPTHWMPLPEPPIEKGTK